MGLLFDTQTDWLEYNGKLDRVDYIGKYENLSSDLKIISKSIDIDLNNIPLLNYNNVRNTYSDMYDFYKKRCYTNPKVVQFVRNKYRKDFKNFDYGMAL